MTTKQDALKIIGIYFLVLILSMGLQFILIPIFKTQLENEVFVITLNTSLNFLVYMIIALLFFVLFKRLFRYDWIITKEHLSETVKYILIGFGLMIVFSVVNTIIYQFLDITETSENQAVINTMFTNGRIIDWVLLALFTVLLAPIVEEFIFRKAIMAFFQSTPIIAIIFSGFAFGFIHVTSGDYIQIISYMSLGIVLASFYYVSKYNIFVPIVIHMIYNGFLVSAMLIQLTSM